MLLLNPVVISVIVMVALCLIKFNVMLSILVAAIVGGLAAGMPIYVSGADNNIIDVLISGMGGNSATALSYILLGAFAVGLAKSGLGTILAKKVSKIVAGKKFLMIFMIAFIACFSQNLVPVHIAFVPILIPPLLPVMNKLKVDRRAVACALTFGLKAPYLAVPMGFGLLFHGILVDNISQFGLPITNADVVSVMWIGALSMFIGLVLVVFLLYSRDREYADVVIEGSASLEDEVHMTKEAWGALAGCIVTAVVSILTTSLPYAAIAGIFTMVITGCIKWSEIDEVMEGGIDMMGFIAFVMLVAAGYGTVLRESGGVEELVTTVAQYMHGSKMIAATLMLLVGLLITMGIGTSFGTIPIIAAIYVPLCQEIGFGTGATILLIGVAAALGDAGSPASDSTLGPTSGLNADGQHDHIWDTCVPTFIAFDIPLMIGGVIGALMLG
ncbi:Na+/H+ antiporter family protein [Anaerosphaera multitolerans]|uniref:Sodium:proton antiporter n=1 Tax=Anaerosphaera multitolerans TaxID=2487351 RepID=A0A437S6S2_9FIRM|nr:SLC13 family permease [Anaerosphaera multitolerans]RVU54730.1 sodium:proton antiporter [Anaerosphaera multitolerans]